MYAHCSCVCEIGGGGHATVWGVITWILGAPHVAAAGEAHDYLREAGKHIDCRQTIFVLTTNAMDGLIAEHVKERPAGGCGAPNVTLPSDRVRACLPVCTWESLAWGRTSPGRLTAGPVCGERVCPLPSCCPSPFPSPLIAGLGPQQHNAARLSWLPASDTHSLRPASLCSHSHTGPSPPVCGWFTFVVCLFVCRHPWRAGHDCLRPHGPAERPADQAQEGGQSSIWGE